MSSNPLRIGVVGVGFGATVHIPGLQAEGLEVAAVCSRRRERAEEAAARFGVGRVFIDYDEMLSDGGIDAVSIVTPLALHHPMALAALRAGKHVICEKALTVTAAEARELWREASERRLTAMVAHEFRFSSARAYAKELIDEGYIGKLRLAFMRLMIGFGRPGGGPPPYSAERDAAAAGSGYFYGLGSHYIDCLRHWFGEVESVSGRLYTLAPDRLSGSEIVRSDADDTFSCSLSFVDGGVAEIVATRVAYFGSGATVELYGSEGTLVTPQPGLGLNPPASGTLLGAHTGDDKLQELPVPERLQPFTDDRDERLMPFRLMVREFVRGVEAGVSPAPNFYDGLRCLQVLEAVHESAATGRRVTIPVE